jgi:hypothetical protein
MYSSPSILRMRMIKLRMRWAGHVAPVVKKKTYRLLVGRPEVQKEDQDIDG